MNKYKGLCLSDFLGSMADDLVDPQNDLEAEKDYVYPLTPLEEELRKAAKALLRAQSFAWKREV